MPEYVVRRTMLALNERGKAVHGSRILLLGLAYKADVDDMRESPTFELMDRFSALGATVAYHDPHVPVIGPTREHARWKGMQSTPWNRETLANTDAVVISTAHKAVDLRELADWSGLVVDTRDAMRNVSGAATVVRA
jgi:UDP-N-acetyl-D-glucosamine dehydrogenase